MSKLKPTSWYYNHPSNTLLLGPSGYNSPGTGLYELESANEALDKCEEHATDQQTKKHTRSACTHHTNFVAIKFKLPPGHIQNRVIPEEVKYQDGEEIK